MSDRTKKLTRPGRIFGIGAACMALGLLGLSCTSCPSPPHSEKQREASPTPRLEGKIYKAEPCAFRVAMFTPHQNTFWDSFTEIMAQAAKDLGISLEVFQAHDSRERMRQQVLSVAGRASPPDYIVFQNFKGIGPDLARIAEGEKVPFFVVNAGLDTEVLGSPRQRNKYWLGQMSPNDIEAGETVARALVEAAKSKKLYNRDGLVEMVAISGVRADVAGRDREEGLQRMLAKSPEVKFHQLVNGDWAGQVAGQRIEDLLLRYPTTKVVWAADESIAMATATRLKELGLAPGKDILVGSVDWASSDFLRSIRNGDIEAAVGGHFTEGAWVCVLLSDYHRGLDFSDRFVEKRTQMVLTTSKNVDEYLSIMRPGFFEAMDFRKMRRPGAGEGYRYPFNPNTLLELIREEQGSSADDREHAP